MAEKKDRMTKGSENNAPRRVNIIFVKLECHALGSMNACFPWYECWCRCYTTAFCTLMIFSSSIITNSHRYILYRLTALTRCSFRSSFLLHAFGSMKNNLTCGNTRHPKRPFNLIKTPGVHISKFMVGILYYNVPTSVRLVGNRPIDGCRVEKKMSRLIRYRRSAWRTTFKIF